MNILAINPPVEDFSAYNLWACPLGLFRVLEQYRKDGHEIQYLDLLDGDVGDGSSDPPKHRKDGRHSYWKRVIKKPSQLNFMPRNYFRFGASSKKVRELISLSKDPDKVLISTGMTYWYRTVVEVVDIVKELYPDAEIEVGGITATLLPELFTRDGVKVHQGRQKIDPDITGTDNEFVNSLKFFPANLVEGCPNRCTYCSSYIFYPKMRFADIKKQVNNLEKWNAATGLIDVAFYDDALLLNKGRYLKAFLDELDPQKYRFHTPNGLHLREVDKELCKYFASYRFDQLRFGFETAFSRYDDKTDLPQLKKVVKMLHESGFSRERIGVYLLCALPGQTIEEVEKTIDIVANAGARPYLSELSPVPGTSVFDAHLKESLLDIGQEPLFQNNSLSAFRSPVFNMEVMNRLKLKMNNVYHEQDIKGNR